MLLARDGVDTASYNEILRTAKLPKASAYHYFDGRADLVETVAFDVATQLVAVFGPWSPQATTAGFRSTLAAGSERLTAHLLTHPEHLALSATVIPLEMSVPGPRAWVGDVVDNGRDLGLIRTDIDRELIVAATLATLQAVDSWAVARLAADPQLPVEPSVTITLLEGLWAPPRSRS